MTRSHLTVTEGIFQKKGDAFIWFTDDKRKMPVMMKSSVKIGPIKATFIGFDQSQIEIYIKD